MALPLAPLLSALQRVAPLGFAEAWDNVGLLIEPSAAAPLIERALLTIDLDERVLDEAEAEGATLLVVYHPPIFQGLKRIRCSEPSERVVARCLSRGLYVYSPHTALDAAPGGVNDWLLDAFGVDAGARAPCRPHPADPAFGQGRALELAQPLSLGQAVECLKRHLGLAQLRVSAAEEHDSDRQTLRRIAVCAGAGGSLFEKLSGFDLYVTGELRHHDVLAKRAAGSSVVLCEHSGSERGYLPLLAARLAVETGGAVAFHVACSDRDPLRLC